MSEGMCFLRLGSDLATGTIQNVKRFEQFQRRLWFVVQERLELERNGIASPRESFDLRCTAWRLRGAIEEIKAGKTPMLF